MLTFHRCLLVIPLTLLPSALIHAEDATDRLARRAVDRFLDAYKASDLDGILSHAELPWFHDGKEIIKDREHLKRAFQEDLARAKDRSQLQHKITQVVVYKAVRESLREEERKLTDEVIGPNDRVLLVLIGRDADKGKGDKVAFLVRIREGQAKVVGLKD